MPDDYLKAMISEVAQKMRSTGIPFRTAFMQVAHRRNIIHSKNADQYNYFFTQVIKKVKQLPGFDPKNQTLPPEEVVQGETPVSEDVPRAIVDYKQLAAHDLFN